MSEDMHAHACVVGNVEIWVQCSLSHTSEDVTAYDNLLVYRRLSLNSGAICITSLSLRVQMSAVKVNEWLFFNATSAIFLLYHGENKVIFNEMMMRSALFSSDTLFWFRANQSLLFLLNAGCLAETTNQFYSLWFDPTGAPTHDLPHSRRARLTITPSTRFVCCKSRKLLHCAKSWCMLSKYAAEYWKLLQSIKNYCRIPQTSAEYRRLLQSTIVCFWTWETFK